MAVRSAIKVVKCLVQNLYSFQLRGFAKNEWKKTLVYKGNWERVA